jgi:hypothetical protein
MRFGVITSWLGLQCLCVLSLAAQSPLPGKGLAQHSFLYCGEGQRGKSEQTMYIVRDGKVAWSYTVSAKDEVSDCSMLPNGNVVFSRRSGASEVTPDKRIIWNYVAPPGTEIHTAYPLDNDHILVMQNGDPAKLLVIRKTFEDPAGEIERELAMETRFPATPHGQFRHVRVTSDGTFLVAHMDLGRVVEYSPDGKPLWSVNSPSPWAAIRLKNGNTLISGNQSGYVREVDKSGKTVWEITQSDLPGIPLYSVQEASRLANGNTLINNWPGGLPVEQWPTAIQLIEVTPAKKVVWALQDWKTLGPPSSTQLLDEPGLQR